MSRTKARGEDKGNTDQSPQTQFKIIYEISASEHTNGRDRMSRSKKCEQTDANQPQGKCNDDKARNKNQDNNSLFEDQIILSS